MHMCGHVCARSSIPTKGNQRKSLLLCRSSREDWGSSAQPESEMRQRHPTVADTMIQELGEGHACCFVAVRTCAQSLRDAGFEVPSWTELAESQEVVFAEEPEPHEPKVGWQQQATKCLHQKFWDEQCWPELTDPQKALMLSQRGPLASVAFAVMPTNRMTRIEAQPFRILLCRRLVCPCPCPLAHANVAANSTFMATIVQRAPRRFGQGGVSSGMCSSGKCAERRERG